MVSCRDRVLLFDVLIHLSEWFDDPLLRLVKADLNICPKLRLRSYFWTRAVSCRDRVLLFNVLIHLSEWFDEGGGDISFGHMSDELLYN